MSIMTERHAEELNLRPASPIVLLDLADAHARAQKSADIAYDRANSVYGAAVAYTQAYQRAMLAFGYVLPFADVTVEY